MEFHHNQIQNKKEIYVNYVKKHMKIPFYEKWFVFLQLNQIPLGNGTENTER